MLTGCLARLRRLCPVRPVRCPRFSCRRVPLAHAGGGRSQLAPLPLSQQPTPPPHCHMFLGGHLVRPTGASGAPARPWRRGGCWPGRRGRRGPRGWRSPRTCSEARGLRGQCSEQAGCWGRCKCRCAHAGSGAWVRFVPTLATRTYRTEHGRLCRFVVRAPRLPHEEVPACSPQGIRAEAWAGRSEERGGSVAGEERSMLEQRARGTLQVMML